MGACQTRSAIKGPVTPPNQQLLPTARAIAEAARAPRVPHLSQGAAAELHQLYSDKNRWQPEWTIVSRTVPQHGVRRHRSLDSAGGYFPGAIAPLAEGCHVVLPMAG